MNRRQMVGVLAGLVLWTGTQAAPAPEIWEETFKDRDAFVPKTKYAPQPKQVIGVLVSEVAPMMNREGRSGPPEAYGFGLNGNSYRWVYVPSDKPTIQNLQVKTGEKGDAVKVYASLSMANPESIKQWGFSEPYCLVEIEVNDGLGSPAEEAFVATKMRRLDDTKDYPLKVAEVIASARKKQEGWLKDQEKVLNDAMADAQTKAVKDAKPTGPRQTHTIMFVTWMAETQKLQVRFLTRISDSVLTEGPGGVKLPPPPPNGKLPPPPPPRFRSGTEFGIECGVGYEVSKSGTIEKILKLPVQAFENKILAP